MQALSPDVKLQLAPKLDIRFAPGFGPQLILGARTVEIRPSALGLLDIFSSPTTVQEAMRRLRERSPGAQSWMELTSELLRWHREGALVAHDCAFAFGREPEAYDAPAVHTRMLNDCARTDAFLHAIREVVRPGDVVLDIGTGTGVLAVAAARAGARRVYAVEMSGILDLAAEVFRTNGFAEVIQPVRGRSTAIDLPERADVLVSEMIGGELLQEEILEITLDARRRLLKPQARLIPAGVELWALPVLVPDSVFDDRFFTRNNVQHWKSWYGLNFTALHDAWRNQTTTFMVNPAAARGWPTVSAAVRLARIGLGEFTATSLDGEGTVICDRSGRVNAVMTFFQAEVSADNCLSTHPAEAPESNHWDNPVRPLREPVDLAKGQTLRIRYSYRKSAQTPHDLSLDLL